MAPIESNSKSVSESDRFSLANNTSNMMLFVFQMLIVLIVVCVSIYNLTINSGDTSMWTALLSSSIGYILPNPKLKISTSDLK